MASYQVRMTAAYDPPRTREVTVPDDELHSDDTIEHEYDTILHNLGLVFKYGQNDFQPQPICSVSVADVIEHKDELYLVLPMGFKQITAKEYEEFVDLPISERRFID